MHRLVPNAINSPLIASQRSLIWCPMHLLDTERGSAVRRVIFMKRGRRPPALIGPFVALACTCNVRLRCLGFQPPICVAMSRHSGWHAGKQSSRSANSGREHWLKCAWRHHQQRAVNDPLKAAAMPQAEATSTDAASATCDEPFLARLGTAVRLTYSLNTLPRAVRRMCLLLRQLLL